MTARPFPRTAAAIHQIEISSRCNLRCIYCPSPAIVAGKYPDRKALDMTEAHYRRALEWVAFYVRQKTQRALNLAGIGESTLHPLFLDFARLAREAVGPSGTLIFATNGLLADDRTARVLADLRVDVFVSLHRPEKAGPAIEIYQKFGILRGASADPAISANDWAGQVRWHSSGERLRCQWLQDGKMMVMADGRLTTCCLDAQGLGVVGHVDDPLGSASVQPYELCKKCYQRIDSENWNQEEGRPK